MSHEPEQSTHPGCSSYEPSVAAPVAQDPQDEQTGPLSPNLEPDASASDSAYEDDDLRSYATSLSSSVQKYRYEHGRRYHAYKAGSYVMPNDEPEQDRLDMSHHMFTLALDGKLFLAPVSEPKRILDIGTGTGIWAIDIADQFSRAEVIGNDLSPIQPEWVPPNATFEVDDVESEWPPRASFDFIHSRYMAGSIKDWPHLIQQCYNQTLPGGWVELQDYDIHLYTRDDSFDPDNAVYRMHEMIIEACEKIGRTVRPGPHLKDWVAEAGFTNIHPVTIPLPMGQWPKDRKQKEIGAFNMLQFLEGLEAFGMGILHKILGWSVEEVQVLLAEVRRDSKKKGVHMMFDFHVVYAQRPS